MTDEVTCQCGGDPRSAVPCCDREANLRGDEEARKLREADVDWIVQETVLILKRHRTVRATIELGELTKLMREAAVKKGLC